MAEHASSIPKPAASEDFDQALSEAQIINRIISYLAEVSTAPNSVFAWLAEELDARLERIEVADMALRSARA